MWKRLMRSLQGEKESLPDFEASDKIRYHVLFYGRVQAVGFRIEIYQMALKLKMTGWVRNLSDGSVEAELQGEEKKVEYLLEHMRKLPRAHVEEIKKLKQAVIEDETQFQIK